MKNNQPSPPTPYKREKKRRRKKKERKKKGSWGKQTKDIYNYTHYQNTRKRRGLL